MLRDELGLDPSPRLQELEQEILRHDPKLERLAERSPGQKVSRRRSRRLRSDAYASLLSELASELGPLGKTDQYADSMLRRISEAD